jgi:chromosomal replication initiator protein
VRVPTTFVKAYLEGRFMDTIRSMLTEITGSPVEVQFIVAKESVSDQGGEDNSVLPPVGRRPYRLPGNRPVSLQAEQANRPRLTIDFGPPSPGPQEAAPTPIAMNSLAPSAPHPSVHRNTSGDEDTPSLFSQPGHESLLNPRYTFDAFIVGKSNQLAHAASLAVADNPGHIYNPMFLYGGVGLGKTHLLHAIGHVGESKGLNVLYVTSEKFTNEIINAIRFQKTEEFRAKYRQIDILLVDDIQFIAGKESTEEEFFHTFNTLHDSNKQIVVTSDRPPKAIHSLQDRLRSRFEWGLLADIQPPVYEHRLAILRSKADSLHFAIPSSVIEYIARPECSSVREIEGWLNRVIAYATLHDAPLSVSLAAKALENLQSDSQKTPTLTTAQVLEGVCRYYNIDIERLKGKQRDREIAWPRQVAMYIMREATHASLILIGAELGGRDHTTVLHGCEKVQSEIDGNDRVRREIATLRETLQHP